MITNKFPSFKFYCSVTHTFKLISETNLSEKPQDLYTETLTTPMKQVASVVLLNEKNEMLLYLRDNKKSIPYPSYWSTLGGHVEEDEKPLQALRREVREEIGFEVENPVFLGNFDDKAGNEVYLYKAPINKRIEELVLTEGQELRFFELQEIHRLKLPPPLKEFLIKNRDQIFV